MERTDSSSAMTSLANMYGEDESDNEERAPSAVDAISDEESMIKMHEPEMGNQIDHVSSSNSPASPLINSDENQQDRKRRATKLVSYGADELDEERSSGDSEDEDSEGFGVYDVTLVDNSFNNTSLSQSVRNIPLDELTLPPEPPGRCSHHLQEKIALMYEKVQKGYDITASILRRRDYRNPSIYEKLVELCGIDEKGTNYPPDVFDPHSWGKESFYDALAEVQKKEMDKREKERKERTKIEFLSGVKKPATNNINCLQSDHSANKKSKWDIVSGSQNRSAIVTTTNTNPLMSTMTSNTGTKTLISAVGNITKK